MPVGMGGIVLGSNGSSFSPIQLNPIVWLRSDLGVTQSITHPGNITQWNDQSGNGYNVSQGTQASQPTYVSSGGTNNLPYLNFGSTELGNANLQNTSFTFSPFPADIFIIATPTNITSNNHVLLDLGITNDYTVINSGFFSLYDGSYINDENIIPATNITYLVEACNLGTASSFVAVNGGTPTVGSVGSASQAATAITIGNYYGTGFNWVGNIYEIVICNYLLSSLQRNQMLTYINTRYGIGV